MNQSLALAPRKRGPLITLGVICAAWETLRHLAIWAGVNLADYRMIIYALSLIVMMIVRPEGLFGVREIWDYLPQSWRWWQRFPAPAKAGPHA